MTDKIWWFVSNWKVELQNGTLKLHVIFHTQMKWLPTNQGNWTCIKCLICPEHRIYANSFSIKCYIYSSLFVTIFQISVQLLQFDWKMVGCDDKNKYGSSKCGVGWTEQCWGVKILFLRAIFRLISFAYDSIIIIPHIENECLTTANLYSVHVNLKSLHLNDLYLKEIIWLKHSDNAWCIYFPREIE